MPDRRQFSVSDFRKAPATEPDRGELAVLDGADIQCTGVWTRCDKIWINHRHVPANLVKDIKWNSRPVADHAWFTNGPLWDDMELRTGEEITFLARVGRYVKGHHNDKRNDFRLFYPRNVRRIIQTQLRQQLPLNHLR